MVGYFLAVCTAIDFINIEMQTIIMNGRRNRRGQRIERNPNVERYWKCHLFSKKKKKIEKKDQPVTTLDSKCSMISLSLSAQWFPIWSTMDGIVAREKKLNYNENMCSFQLKTKNTTSKHDPS